MQGENDKTFQIFKKLFITKFSNEILFLSNCSVAITVHVYEWCVLDKRKLYVCQLTFKTHLKINNSVSEMSLCLNHCLMLENSKDVNQNKKAISFSNKHIGGFSLYL